MLPYIPLSGMEPELEQAQQVFDYVLDVFRLYWDVMTHDKLLMFVMAAFVVSVVLVLFLRLRHKK